MSIIGENVILNHCSSQYAATAIPPLSKAPKLPLLECVWFAGIRRHGHVGSGQGDEHGRVGGSEEHGEGPRLTK